MTLPALVIFDMAGTTVEDRGQVAAAFAETLAANQIAITAEDVHRVRGASKREAIRNLLRSSAPEAADRVYAQFREHLSARYVEGGVRPVAGADGVIAALRARDIKVALTTGFDREIAALLVSALGWTTAIDAMVCGDDVWNGRPAPDLILEAMRLTSVRDRALVANAGDTTLDLESAARAGVKWNIGVLTGAHTREALSRAPHTHLVESVANLPF